MFDAGAGKHGQSDRRVMNDVGAPAGWYRDPTGQGSGRYWNGVSWTEMVERGGTTINAPIDPQQARTPPVPGTQIAAPVYPAARAANDSAPNRTGLGLIIGGIVVAIIGVVILVLVGGDSSDDSPTPGTDAPAVSVAPPGTDAPATPSTDGG